jgi:hypothetical protein
MHLRRPNKGKSPAHKYLRLHPPFFLQRGYPRERISYGSGAPPSCGGSAGPPCVVPPVCPTAGVPQGAYFVREWGPLSIMALCLATAMNVVNKTILSVPFRRHRRNCPDSEGFSRGTPVAFLQVWVGTHH